jgi:tetratricopeptide (TPR) repeat protein
MMMLTHGAIALRNLQAQIDGLEPVAVSSDPRIEDGTHLIELLALHGTISGTIADHERAYELANRLARNSHAAAFLARARTRAQFHLFADALDDLDAAERLAADVEAVILERAAIFQGLGRYEEALAILEDAARRSPGFESLGALMTLHAERGDTERALQFRNESLGHYHGVSPIPLALLEFQVGHMWMRSGDLQRARDHMSAARRYLPGYAPAQGHLAEVEAELGNIQNALALLRPLAASSDDPDYAVQLARILAQTGSVEESRRWRQLAAARYEELITLHAEAYADHAAEFWLGAGADAGRALQLSRLNLAIRGTPRAHALLSRALAAQTDSLRRGRVNANVASGPSFSAAPDAAAMASL